MGEKETFKEVQQLNAGLPGHLRLAQAYIPFQILTTTFPPMEALQRGTLFPELYRPYRRMR